jgi:hypothetical protein
MKRIAVAGKQDGKGENRRVPRNAVTRGLKRISLTLFE